MRFYKQTVDSGVRPLELLYQRVISTEFSRPVAYRSRLAINSVDLGVLMPEQYIPVAERTTQCIDLANWNINAVLEDIIALGKREVEYDWISVYIPVRMLLKTKLAANISRAFTEKQCELTNKLCLEFPIELLYEDRAAVNEALSQVRDAGFRVMLTGFGSEFCPTLRLGGLMVDTILLDEYITGFFRGGDGLGVPESVIGFIRDCGCDVVAGGVETQDEIDEAYNYNCMGAVGKISGQDIRIATILKG